MSAVRFHQPVGWGVTADKTAPAAGWHHTSQRQHEKPRWTQPDVTRPLDSPSLACHFLSRSREVLLSRLGNAAGAAAERTMTLFQGPEKWRRGSPSPEATARMRLISVGCLLSGSISSAFCDCLLLPTRCTCPPPLLIRRRCSPGCKIVRVCSQHTDWATSQSSIRVQIDRVKTRKLKEIESASTSSIWFDWHKPSIAAYCWVWMCVCCKLVRFSFACVCFAARSKSMVMGEVTRGPCRPASPSLQEGALKAGWLKKQRSIMKNWQLRWFVLRSDQLFFYKDEEETKPQVRESVFSPQWPDALVVCIMLSSVMIRLEVLSRTLFKPCRADWTLVLIFKGPVCEVYSHLMKENAWKKSANECEYLFFHEPPDLTSLVHSCDLRFIKLPKDSHCVLLTYSNNKCWLLDNENTSFVWFSRDLYPTECTSELVLVLFQIKIRKAEVTAHLETMLW